MKITIDSKIYSRNTIHKALYWFCEEYTFNLLEKDQFYTIEISKPNSSCFSKNEKAELEHRIRKSIIDFKTREIVLAETKSVRDLIIMKAFFHFDDAEIDLEKILDY